MPLANRSSVSLNRSSVSLNSMQVLSFMSVSVNIENLWILGIPGEE